MSNLKYTVNNGTNEMSLDDSTATPQNSSILLLQAHLDKKIQVKKKSMRELVELTSSCDQKRDSLNEWIIADLMHRLRKEIALVTGAKNMLKILGEQKKPDFRITEDALDTNAQAQQKIDLICLALKKHTSKLPVGSPKRASLNDKIEKLQNFPNISLYNFEGLSSLSLDSDKLSWNSVPNTLSGQSGKMLANCPFSSTVSGKLEIRLIGCQDLILHIKSRFPRNEMSTFGISEFSSSKRRNNKYSIRHSKIGCNFSTAFCAIVPPDSPVSSLSSFQNERFSCLPEVFAVLKINSHTIASTLAKPMSSHCWDEKFVLDLDKDRELEIEIFYKEGRSMCAFGVIKLVDVSELKAEQFTLNLEPRGLVFLEMKLQRDPLAGHLTKLERHKRLFHSQERNSRDVASTFRYLSSSARAHLPPKSSVESVISNTPLSSIFQRTFLRHNQNRHYEDETVTAIV